MRAPRLALLGVVAGTLVAAPLTRWFLGDSGSALLFVVALWGAAGISMSTYVISWLRGNERFLVRSGYAVSITVVKLCLIAVLWIRGTISPEAAVGATGAAFLLTGALGLFLLPRLYVYHQDFEAEGQKYTRKGFMARVRLEQFGEGRIYPHEETLAGPKADPDPALNELKRVVAIGSLSFEQLPHLAQAAGVLVMPYADLQGVTVVQLCGNLGAPYSYRPDQCTMEIARRLNAKGLNFYAPLVLSTEELARALRAEPVIREQLSGVGECDLDRVGGCRGG